MPLPKDPLKSEFFTNFASETELHGFGHIGPSHWWLERLVWILLIILGAGLTARDATNLFETYFKEPTSTISIVERHEKVNMGKPTMCVILFPKYFKTAIDDKNVTQVKEFLDSFGEISIGGLYKYLTTKPADEVMKKNQSNYLKSDEDLAKEILDGYSDAEVENDNKDLLYLTYKMLAFISRAENDHSLPNKQQNIGEFKVGHSENVDKRELHNRFLMNKYSFYMVHEFYRSRGVFLPNLTRIVGAELCRKMHMKYYVGLGSEHSVAFNITQVDPCNREWITWLGLSAFAYEGMEYLCLQPDQNVTFSTMGDYIAMTVDSDRLYDHFWMKSGTDTIGYIDLSSEPVQVGTKQDVFPVKYHTYRPFYIEILAHYKAINLKRRPCSDSRSFLSCRVLCRAKFILRHCKCWPLSTFTFWSKPKWARFCGDGNHAFGQKSLLPKANVMCRSIQYTYDPDKECMKVCPPLCTMKDYKFKRSYDHPWLDETNTTSAQLILRQFIFPTFQEQLVMDEQGLISNFGGIIGLWLGASFLAFFHLFTYVLKAVLFIVVGLMQRARQAATLEVIENSKTDANDNEEIQELNGVNGAPIASDDL